jgi:hypothetical protein
MALSTIGTASVLALSRSGDRIVSALVLVPAGAVAALLVGFFAWRESLRREAGPTRAIAVGEWGNR